VAGASLLARAPFPLSAKLVRPSRVSESVEEIGEKETCKGLLPVGRSELEARFGELDRILQISALSRRLRDR
jgi:hypothetical protein